MPATYAFDCSSPHPFPCNPPQGVEAVAVHGDKAQEDRHAAIASFKKGDADVLVATDVASKVPAWGSGGCSSRPCKTG